LTKSLPGLNDIGYMHITYYVISLSPQRLQVNYDNNRNNSECFVKKANAAF